jgi:hypothetical protein
LKEAAKCHPAKPIAKGKRKEKKQEKAREKEALQEELRRLKGEVAAFPAEPKHIKKRVDKEN